jgi:hypothetical protein
MRRSLHWLGAAVAVALLVLGPAAVWAGEEMGKEETLTGLLSSDGQGGYQLTDQASGDRITLKGSADFSSHVGSTVTVTGIWSQDEAGNKVFEVSRVEPAAAAE